MSVAIPTLDFSLSNAVLAKPWREAFSVVGFCRIKNHGIRGLDELKKHSRTFFSQPLECKLESRLNDKYGFGGYTPSGVEAVAKTLDESTAARPDPVESLVFCGNEVPHLDIALQRAAQAYYASASSVVERIMQISALALDLSEDFFSQSFREPSHSLRIAKYGKIEGDGLLYGEHTDYTGYTLLSADPLQGFEIKFPGQQEWSAVADDGEKGTLLVNSGDLIKRWTGDAFHSTLHRVRKVDNNDENRMSVVRGLAL